MKQQGCAVIPEFMFESKISNDYNSIQVFYSERACMEKKQQQKTNNITFYKNILSNLKKNLILKFFDTLATHLFFHVKPFIFYDKQR